MMSNNFWEDLRSLSKPILALAPMAGFTDSSFRIICQENGADVLYSEMASVAALYYGQEGRSSDGAEATYRLLDFSQKERPYIVQLFGNSPEHFALAARLVSERVRPDGIDINFGCPVLKIVKQGAGASLMADLKLSRKVIEAVLANTNLPVSIKIRAASGSVSALSFIKNISDLPISALMVHGRTLKQGFIGEVDHGLIKTLRPYFSGAILTNGGIDSLEDGLEALKLSEADGLGLARGVLGRPWLFKEIKEDREINLCPEEIFNLIISQARLIKDLKGEVSFLELRKHLVWYTQGLRNAKFLRERLVTISSLKEIEKAILDYKKYDSLHQHNIRK